MAHCKTHDMVTSYRNKTLRMSLTLKTQLLCILCHRIPHKVQEANDLSDEYCEETDTHSPLADLLYQFQQLKKQFASLKN